MRKTDDTKLIEGLDVSTDFSQIRFAGASLESIHILTASWKYAIQ